jgi:hypothetical protein
VTSPDPKGLAANDTLTAVTTWRRSAWAVGQYNVVSGSISVSYSLILHWTGTRWVRMPSPNR